MVLFCPVHEPGVCDASPSCVQRIVSYDETGRGRQLLHQSSLSATGIVGEKGGRYALQTTKLIPSLVILVDDFNPNHNISKQV